jgi:methionyl-tRNA formyltransferase
VKAVLFGYHTMGCVGFDALVRHGFDVRAIVTHRDDPRETVWWDSLADRGAARGLPVVFRDRPEEPGLLEAVASREPDILFSFYYRHMLPEEVLKAAPRGALNLHGSLLPRYRGRAPVNWVLVNGEVETGVTLHYMTSKPDAGDVVDREAVPISPVDTAYTVFRKLETAAGLLLDRALPAIATGTVAPIPQDPSRRSYFGGRRPDDGRIDWSWPALRIYNLVRAVTHPYPGAFTVHAGRRLFVWWALPSGGVAAGPPGTVLAVEREGIVVATGDGAIRLVTLQTEGRPELPACAFALAEQIVPGERLGVEGVPE